MAARFGRSAGALDEAVSVLAEELELPETDLDAALISVRGFVQRILDASS